MKITSALATMALLLAACAPASGSTSPELGADGECPVTIPPDPGFQAPEPWPSDPSVEDWVWYGTEDLWTVLSPDGDHPLTKGVWWSANFPGGKTEEKPDLRVTWTRIGEGEPELLASEHPGTNAYTVEDHWFMINGVNPVPGCWEVAATYKEATLSYVFEYVGG